MMRVLFYVKNLKKYERFPTCNVSSYNGKIYVNHVLNPRDLSGMVITDVSMMNYVN